MTCKNKIAHGILKMESKFYQFFFGPLPCRNHLLPGLFKVCLIADCLDPKGERGLVHRVRIERIFDIIDVAD